jgi:hypothetical protein
MVHDYDCDAGPASVLNLNIGASLSADAGLKKKIASKSMPAYPRITERMQGQPQRKESTLASAPSCTQGAVLFYVRRVVTHSNCPISRHMQGEYGYRRYPSRLKQSHHQCAARQMLGAFDNPEMVDAYVRRWAIHSNRPIA